MNLAIDIGNTRAKFGFFKGSELKSSMIMEEWDTTKVYGLLTSDTKIIISKTSDRYDHYINGLKASFDVIELDHKTPLPIAIDYKTPETLGRDRIAGVIGARSMFMDEPCLVIDAGTCITYDVIDKKGVYRGGQIAPGLHMRLKAMHQFTDKLPLLEWNGDFEMIGKSTSECMISGAILGTINEMKGFINDYNKAFDSINIVITGGDNQFFVLYMKTEILAVPSLVLQGLNEILNFNERSF